VILDTSALVAVLRREPDARLFRDAIAGAARPAMSAATLVELSLVASSRGGGARGVAEADALLLENRVEIVPFTAEHAALAREGWRRYGKGNHPAALNFGDCFSYALAKARNEPLLFKGGDFAQTDVKAAI
jgi:ribonuclease VapC